MEEKLAELFLVAKEFSAKSKKYYIELSVDFEGMKRLEISIRNKGSFDFIETQTIYLKDITESRLEKLIEFIEDYEV